MEEYKHARFNDEHHLSRHLVYRPSRHNHGRRLSHEPHLRDNARRANGGMVKKRNEQSDSKHLLNTRDISGEQF
jgi:hypothetical protein